MTMKRHLNKLATLLLAIALILSLAGTAEDLPVSEVLDTDRTVATDEMPEALDNGDMLTISADAQETYAAESNTAPTEEKSSGVVSNAIPSKVKIGVKEKYTIDTSDLSGKLTFKSSKKSVATVSSKGVVTGKKAGTAKITVTPKKGKKKTITVTVAKAPKKVTLNMTNETVTVGETLQLKATLPSKTASNKLTWTSSNKNVATVSKSGKVTAKKAGTATITVKTFNGKKATCKVTVEEPEEEGYTGDIWDAIGMDINIFSDALDDPLTLYSYEDDYICYINGYMMVSASYYDNSILTIMLNSGDKNGKYTINQMHPGNNLVLTKMEAEDAGWEYWKTEGTRYWYRAWHNGETFYLVITAEGNSGSSNVNYVTIMRTE